MVVRWWFWAPHRVQNAMRVQNARSWAHKYAVGAHFRGCIGLENFASVSVYAGVVWSGARFRGCAFSRVHRQITHRKATALKLDHFRPGVQSDRVRGSVQKKKGGGGQNRAFAHSAMCDSALAREIPSLTRRRRQCRLLLEDIGTIFPWCVKYHCLYYEVSACNRPAGKWCQLGERDTCKLPVFSLVNSGRFVMRFAVRPSTVLTMASAAAPTRQRPPEVRSWHVHRLPKSHIYVQIDFCV